MDAVDNKKLRLYKKEKLCNQLAIASLFAHGSGAHYALAYPIRAVWKSNPGRKSDAPIQFLISVPKKRLRHAVDRVTMRRRIREAYRLLHQQYSVPAGEKYDLLLIYVDSVLLPYQKVEKAMHRLLAKIAQG